MARRRERSFSVPLSLGALVGSGYPPPAPIPLGLPRLTALDDLRSMEDNRRFHPELAARPAQSVFRESRRLVIGAGSSPGRVSPLPASVAFSEPRQVVRCVRRKIRKEVILASGRGGGGHRPPRRNYWSDVEC